MSREDLISGVIAPPPRRHLDVVRITSTEPEMLVVVSDQVVGIEVHWVHGRSKPCTGDPLTCEWCKVPLSKRWQGYLHVVKPHKRWNGFLEFTANAFDLMVAQLAEGETFRGVIMRVGKTKGGPKGRYLIEVLQRRADMNEIPPAADPWPTLKFLWNVKSKPDRKTA